MVVGFEGGDKGMTRISISHSKSYWTGFQLQALKRILFRKHSKLSFLKYSLFSIHYSIIDFSPQIRSGTEIKYKSKTNTRLLNKRKYRLGLKTKRSWLDIPTIYAFKCSCCFTKFILVIQLILINMRVKKSYICTC